jgi:hypothetical protein
MANASQVPDVTETDLERSDLEEAARELGIDDFDELEDQELFERIGVALGEIDLDELEDAAEQVDESADDAGDEAEETADEAEETAEDAVDEADDTAEDAVDEADDTAEDGGAGAAEDEDEGAEDVEAEDVEAEDEPASEGDEGEGEHEGEDEDGAAESGEYRFEDDPREGIEPVLDLETGPVALDVLGVEIHLRRVHAVLTANPNGGRNILGKLLAQVATAMRSSSDEDDPSAEDTSDEDETSGDEESGDHGGLLDTITSPARGLARGAKKIVGKD